MFIQLNYTLGIIISILVIFTLIVKVLHWLIDVRSRLSANESSISAIKDWIKVHEAMVERQIEMFNQLRIAQAALATQMATLIERFDRTALRIQRMEERVQAMYQQIQKEE